MADDISMAKIAAGAAGAFVSLRFVQGSRIERLLMGVGGAALSYYATSPVAVWVRVQDAEGLIGFLIGVFGMSLVAKVYEVLTLLDAKQAAVDLLDWVKRKIQA